MPPPVENHPFEELLNRFRFVTSPAHRYQVFLQAFRDASLNQGPVSPLKVVEPLSAGQCLHFLTSFGVRRREAREKRAGHVEGMNVWRHAGLGRHEVRNVAVLAWLLDPRGDHGQGLRFYRCLSAVFPGLLPVFADGDEPYVRTEQWADDDHRVDVELVGIKDVVLIEAKIGARVRLTQIEDYWAINKARFKNRTLHGVLLTLGSPTPQGKHSFRGLHWREVVSALSRFSGEDENAAADPLVRALSLQFAEYLSEMIEE